MTPRMAAVYGLTSCLLMGAGCASPNAIGSRDHNSTGKAKVDIAERSSDSPSFAAQDYLQQSREAETNGDLTQAIELCRQARTLDRNLPGVSHRLAVLHARQLQGEQAEVEFRQALQESPRDAKLVSDYGFFLLETGQLAAAEQQFRQALKISPHDERARTNLAIVLAERGDYAASRELFAGTAGEAAAWSNVGAIMARKGEWDSAELAFQKAAAIDPTLSQPQAFLAYAREHRTSDKIVEAGYER